MFVRHQPAADVILHDHGLDGKLKPTAQGLFYPDFLWRSWHTYSQMGLVENFGTQKENLKLFLVKEIGRVVCTPISVNGSSSLSDWELPHSDKWVLYDDLDPGRIGYNSPEKLKRLAFEEDNTQTWAKSTFRIPEEGSWSIILRRFAPKATANLDNCFSKILLESIEGDSYMLKIPYDGSMVLLKKPKPYVDDKGTTITPDWQPVGIVFLPANYGQLNDEGANFIRVDFWNLDGSLLFSGDGFRNNHVYKETERIKLKDYKIIIEHSGSAWQFNFLQTKYETGFFKSTRIPFWYRTKGELNTTEFVTYPRFSPGLGTINVTYVAPVEGDTTTSVDSDTETALVYKCTMTPATATLDGKTWYQTPQLEAVGVNHKPIVEGDMLVPIYNLAAPYEWTEDGMGGGERVFSMQGEEGLDYDASHWNISLDNFDAKMSDPKLYPSTYPGPFKVVRIMAGYYDKDHVRTVESMGYHVIVTPTFGSYQDQKNTVGLRLTNLAWICQAVKNKGDWPVFDGWVIKDAIEWLALKCRIPEDRMGWKDPSYPVKWSEILDQQLSKGTPHEPLWHPQVLQTSAWDMMKKIADYIKFRLFFDREGVLQLEPMKFGWDEDYSFQHTFYACDFDVDLGDPLLIERQDDGTLVFIGDDLEGARTDITNIATDIELSINGEEFYNTLYIGGYNQMGGVISTFYRDDASIYDNHYRNHVGFEKSIAVAYETIIDKEKTREIADMLYHGFLMYPRKISFTTYFNPYVKANEVIKVKGSRHPVIGTTDNPCYYRIISLNHNINMNGIATTNIIGEYLGDNDYRQCLIEAAGDPEEIKKCDPVNQSKTGDGVTPSGG